ncbi:MAG TPA: TRAP transporter small permease [Desulfobacteraceae bacterium]|nr:TRAP transporter small permease [Desulfobacteraceae bacterium]
MSSNAISRIFGGADKFISNSISLLIIVGGAMVALTVVLQVLLRYVFKVPLFGLEEFSRLIAVWVYFFGAVLGTKWDTHVQGDVAGRLFSSARARAVIKTVTWVVSLVVCGLFLYHAAAYSLWLYGTGERTTGLWWPRIYSVGSMFFGALFMTLYSIANVARYAKEAAVGSRPAAGGAS